LTAHRHIMALVDHRFALARAHLRERARQKSFSSASCPILA
jgi:hypothetical protein